MRFKAGRFPALSLVFAFTLFPVTGESYLKPPQQKQQSQSACPTVDVTCPDTVTKGDKLTISANVRGGDSQVTPTFNWTVSAGTIESGQGTPVIEVDTSGVFDGGTVTATVDVGGFSRECSTSDSCTSSVEKKAEARKTDEYGAIKLKDEQARLDNFAIEIMQDPTAQGIVIAYGGRASRPGDARKVAERAKTYLVKKRGADPARIAAMDGGYREEPQVELWIVPAGAGLPTPTPTVDKSEIAKPSRTKTRRPKKM